MLAAASLLAAQGTATRLALPVPEAVAPGVDLFRLSDPALVSPPAPIAVHALRLDPRRVRLTTALAQGRSPAKETVPELAARHQAVAAVNAGFFVVATGAPAGVLKVEGRLIGAAALPRGAVGIMKPGRRQPLRLLFDQVSAEWKEEDGRRTPVFSPRLGSSRKDWSRVPWVVGGAGLLLHKGRLLGSSDWTGEKVREGFATERHPRTIVGMDGDGRIWLVTVDGRNPGISVGMTFSELQQLSVALGLRDALNLDGGGSTTMVVKGTVVNRPSDPTGPRAVSDALLVFSR